MATWAWGMPAWLLLLGLAIGLGVGRLWGLCGRPTPPAVNPWERRACREWDGER